MITKLEPKKSDVIMIIFEGWIHSNETEECSEKNRIGETVFAVYKTKDGQFGSISQTFSRAQQSLFFDEVEYHEFTDIEVENNPLVKIIKSYRFELETATISDIETMMYSKAA